MTTKSELHTIAENSRQERNELKLRIMYLETELYRAKDLLIQKEILENLKDFEKINNEINAKIGTAI